MHSKTEPKGPPRKPLIKSCTELIHDRSGKDHNINIVGFYYKPSAD